MLDTLPPAIAIMGPTASGKTALALQFADHCACEIISVDSSLVYRGMNIGTAKPTAATLVNYPHRLLDICDPSERYSVARFRVDALNAMATATANGRIPLCVGGTMLYFKALQQGLAQLPTADAGIREALTLEGLRVGWAAMHRRLMDVDPVAAARIHPNDPQRIQRALEVYQVTGIPLTTWLEKAQPQPLPYRLYKIALAPADRDELHRRIAQRFQQMLAQGLIDEVRQLMARGDLHPQLPALRAVGYRQVWAYLAEEYDYATMVTKAVTATCQLAKRQMTWLRAEPEVHWYTAAAPEIWENARLKLGI
ncbi:MAG: tRNA (adenosine(37)-N6)-dimethylallyltransferase MiaA [Pseudomonadota bacterium]